MITEFGATPPLHRRFNEATAMRHVRNRYSRMRQQIANQVVVLQQDRAFRRLCQEYYGKGYPDWVVLSAIVNVMMNQKAQESGHDILSFGTNRQLVTEVLDRLSDTVYSPRLFHRTIMDSSIGMHCMIALQTYGFSPRRNDFDTAVVEKFLRERMRHFDFDLPHEPIFGDPPGNWPTE